MSMSFQMAHGTVFVPQGESEIDCPCGCGERWFFRYWQEDTRLDLMYKRLKPEQITPVLSLRVSA
jgi:hypothetical protein